MDQEAFFDRLKKVPKWVLLIGPVVTAAFFTAPTAIYVLFHNFSINPDSNIVASKLSFSFNPLAITIPRNTNANVTMTLSSENGLTNRYYIYEEHQDMFFPAGAGFYYLPLFLPRNGSVSTIMTVSSNGPVPPSVTFPSAFTLHLDACTNPNYCSFPSIVWKAMYNVTVT